MTSPLASARRIVVKLGSAQLVDPETGDAHATRLSAIAQDLAGLCERGMDVVIVSSGAGALGRHVLNLTDRKLRLEEKQAAAAAGQTRLMRAWEDAFAPFGFPVAQTLLTIDDTETRRRWLNGRATLNTLIELGAIPIVNENDTVATEEIRYGDNDRLAARVAQMVGADVLVLLSDIDGLYTSDPRKDPDARHIAVVDKLTPDIMAMGGDANVAAGVGSGGMATKLEAARIALTAGCATAITLGDQTTRDGGPLKALESGARATWFMPEFGPDTARRQWLAGNLNPSGVLFVDDGAAQALARGKSLLPAGVSHIEGRFERGDAVEVHDATGAVIARGVCAYASADALRIMGRKTAEIETVLGYKGRPALIHRDDLVLTHEGTGGG